MKNNELLEKKKPQIGMFYLVIDFPHKTNKFRISHSKKGFMMEKCKVRINNQIFEIWGVYLSCIIPPAVSVNSFVKRINVWDVCHWITAN